MATPPRIVIPDTTHLCSRRTSERRFFLKPSKRVNDIIMYCYAWAVQKHSIKVHDFMFEFNHYHEVVTDVFGNLPAFKRDFHSILSRALAHHHRRPWPIWDHESYSDVIIETDEALNDAITYTLANPVQDGLVSKISKWECVSSYRLDYGQEIPLQKPKGFFSDEMPDEITFSIHAPPSIGISSDRDAVIRMADKRAKQVRDEQITQGQGPVGMAALLRMRITDSPKSFRCMFKRKPTIKAKNKWVMIAAIQRTKKFRQQYHQARMRLIESEHKVRFPVGTYGLVSLGIAQT